MGFKKIQAHYRQVRLITGLVVCALVMISAAYSALPANAKSPAAAPGQSQTTVLAVVSNAATKIVSQPDGDTLLTLDPGAVVTAFGRTSDSVWIAVRSENGKVGWMKASDTVLFGIETLAVLDPADALPGATAANTATPTSEPATATAAPTQSPTPKPTEPPTATALPTQAATTPPTATATPKVESAAARPTKVAGVSLLGIVGGKGATLKESPAAEKGTQLEAGTSLTIVGRNEASDWLRAKSENGGEGWISADEVVAFDLPTLPVVNEDGTSPAEATAEPEEEAAKTDTEATPTATPAEEKTETTAAPAKAQSGVTVVVKTAGASLRLRSGPGTGYAIIGSLANGSSYTATGRDSTSNWVRVNLADGTSGWLSTGYLSTTGSLADLPIVPIAARAADVGPKVDTTTTTPAATAQPAAQPATQTSAQSAKQSAPTGLSGKLVVSSGFGGTFYVYNLQNGTLQPVTTGYDPAISPDGTRIAFTRVGGENGVYIINIDGSDERKLYGGGELLSSPKWNADGSKIVFSRATGKTVCRTPGFGICLPDTDDFAEFDKATVVTFGLSRVKVDDKDFRDLAVVGSALAPDWDNDNIIYRASRGFKITMDKPTVDVKTVTEDSGFQDPDLYGNRIVYQSKSGNHWEVMVMNDDASGQTYLTRPVTTLVDELPNNVAPAWSPDGKYIVFLSNRSEDNSAGAWAVWVMNADGSNQRRLPIDINIKYGYAQEQMVSWGK